MKKGIFITATDTGVGKTVVSAMIIRALLLRGIKTGAMKPFETGCQRKGEELIPSDGTFLKDMAEMDDDINLVTPVRFELPLAPFVASRLEKRPVQIENIIKAYEYLQGKYRFIVIEGVGGIRVPIAYENTEHDSTKKSDVIYVSDIIKEFDLPVIIVSRPTLGTINHTLLTARYALNEGLKVVGIIINYNSPPGADISEETNPGIISELSPVPVLGILPHCQSIDKKTIDIVVNERKRILDNILDIIIDKH